MNIYQEGEGPTVALGTRVKAHYTGTLLDGTKFDSSRDRGQPLDFVVGVGQVIKCWDDGFLQMRKGSKAIFTCPSGYTGDPFSGCSLVPDVIREPPEVIDPCNPPPCRANAECFARNRAGACRCIQRSYWGSLCLM